MSTTSSSRSVVDQPIVTDQQNCGNILAGVAPFAIERGLVPPPPDGEATVRIHMLNTGGVAVATFPACGTAWPIEEGDTSIAGVPGAAAPIRLDFVDTAGSSCGALLPSGHAVDVRRGHPGHADRQRDAGRRAPRRRRRRHRLRGAGRRWRPTGDLRDALERIRLAVGPA